MDINNFSLDVRDRVLIITSKKGVSHNEMLEIKSLFETSSEHVYNYVMYKDGLGYYHTYDFINEDFIYCTTLNLKRALEFLNKQIKENG